MMWCFLFVLGAAVVSIDGQLEFQKRQRGHEVNINCTLKGIQDTNMFLLIGMSVSRLTDTHEDLLASATSVGSKPVIHSNSGAVSSSISIDGSRESYLNIQWQAANDTLEGEYLCKATGIDANNSPSQLTETLALDVRDQGPGIQATPEILETGLRSSLSVRCYIGDLVSLNVSEVTSIDLSHLHAGIDQLLASISVFEGTEVKPGSELSSVDGYIGSDPYQEIFLEATWDRAGQNRTGIYVCTFNGLDINGNPVYFEYTHNLTIAEPTKEELMQHIQELQNKFDNIYKENTELAAERSRTAIRLRVLEESIKGHKICDSVNLPVGQYPITLFPDDGLGLLNVLCDVVSPGDVWTVFQKRYNGKENFNRDKNAYDNGFGSIEAEHWLGFKKIKRIMAAGKYQIRVDLIDHNGANHSRIYPTFDIGPSDRYTLTAGGYNDGGHGLSFSSGADFSTYDSGPQPHCAIQDHGGWWYENCAFTNLNGQWGLAGESGVSWFELPDGRLHPLKATEMKFKKANLP